jgi:hypothetical protein
LEEKVDTTNLLSDFEDPLVQSKAIELTQDEETLLGKLECIFYYVRDGIKFGFPPKWDIVKASETMGYGIGYCNTKATLYLALCKAAGIRARLHCALIDINIMRGILPDIAFPFMPKAGSHAWVDVLIDDQWESVDSYINDKMFYEGSLLKLKESGRPLGYSVSFINGQSSCEFNFGEKGFVHMGAVKGDHGTWNDLSEYLATDKYVSFNAVQLLAVKMFIPLLNSKIEGIRSTPERRLHSH